MTTASKWHISTLSICCATVIIVMWLWFSIKFCYCYAMHIAIVLVCLSVRVSEFSTFAAGVVNLESKSKRTPSLRKMVDWHAFDHVCAPGFHWHGWFAVIIHIFIGISWGMPFCLTTFKVQFVSWGYVGWQPTVGNREDPKSFPTHLVCSYYSSLLVSWYFSLFTCFSEPNLSLPQLT